MNEKYRDHRDMRPKRAAQPKPKPVTIGLQISEAQALMDHLLDLQATKDVSVELRSAINAVCCQAFTQMRRVA